MSSTSMITYTSTLGSKRGEAIGLIAGPLVGSAPDAAVGLLTKDLVKIPGI